MSLPLQYDIIVVGAGIAGLLASISAAKHSNNRLRILLIDKNRKEELGKKTMSGWVCGDATEARSIEYINQELGITLDSPEIEHRVDGVIAYSPDRETAITFEGAGYMLNRKYLPQRLLLEAKRVGVDVQTDILVNSLLIDEEDGRKVVAGVKGLYTAQDRRGEIFKARAKVVIDATGASTTLRCVDISDSMIEQYLDRDDIDITARYILHLGEDGNNNNNNNNNDNDNDNNSSPYMDSYYYYYHNHNNHYYYSYYYDPSYALIHFNQELTPGGYGWVFPKGNNRVNVGIGIQQRSLDMLNARIALSSTTSTTRSTTNAAASDANAIGTRQTLHTLLNKYIQSNPILKNARISTDVADQNNAYGTWFVTTRRMNSSLVAHGYMLAGDAGWLTNPLTGGGIWPAVLSGILAGRYAVQAIEANDVSQRGLWQYNLAVIQEYGFKTPALEVFKLFLQSLNNEELNYLLKYFISKAEIMAVLQGKKIELSFMDTVNMAIRALIRYKVGDGLRYAANLARELIALYKEEYPAVPDTDKFIRWYDRQLSLIIMAKSKFASSS
ncbi:MAG: NAD(P)/FAD-dependent oxidoreductase [Candidatus Nitrosocaldus sp.]